VAIDIDSITLVHGGGIHARTRQGAWVLIAAIISPEVKGTRRV